MVEMPVVMGKVVFVVAVIFPSQLSVAVGGVRPLRAVTSVAA